ncbi:MAG TPA: Rieske 2Fe-2S domain-containing protein [Dehalococcoidia bacterium]|nr:Rieske 2Fe-2S domain-containing protein [Dehalococcoidia bacterium]
MISQSAINIDELIRETPDQFRVRGRVYTDPDIFDLEMENIFYRAWVYLGHASEIPDGGDYKTTFIGQQPVIMSRNADDGQVYVFYNRCRHRGATVCQQEYGSGNFFRCAYHGWVYNNRGELVGVPTPEYYGAGFRKEEMGLDPVPRVDNYRGFIFASLAPQGESLLEHLGNARGYIDRFIDQWPEGEMQLSGVQKYGYNGNWKLQLENTVDNYHFPFVHASMLEIAKRQAASYISSARGDLSDRQCWDLGNGHAAFDAGLGDVHFAVFPNLALLGYQVRVIRPIAVDRTDVLLHATTLKGAPAEVNERRLRTHVEGFGPAGFIGPDDQEIAMTRVPQGLRASKATDWVLMERGLELETFHEDGRRSNPMGCEVTHRSIYRRWRQLMAAGS